MVPVIMPADLLSLEWLTAEGFMITVTVMDIRLHLDIVQTVLRRMSGYPGTQRPVAPPWPPPTALARATRERSS